MPNIYEDADRAALNGRLRRYDRSLNKVDTLLLIGYFRFVDKLSLDDAIRKVDAIEDYLRSNR